LRSKNRKRAFSASANVNPHAGSNLDDFLKADGIYDDVTAKPIARAEHEAGIAGAAAYLEATRDEFAAAVEKAQLHFAGQREGGVLVGPVEKKLRR
jgi:hypothetical protein